MSRPDTKPAVVWDVVGRRSVELDVDDVLRLYKPEDGDSDDDPTAVVMVDGSTILVSESIKTVSARWGTLQTWLLQDYDHGDARRPSYVNMDHVVLLTKPLELERAHGDEGDPTEMHLVNGEVLRTSDSIRTLTARMESMGIETRDVDIPWTDRPAALAERHEHLVRPDFTVARRPTGLYQASDPKKFRFVR